MKSILKKNVLTSNQNCKRWVYEGATACNSHQCPKYHIGYLVDIKILISFINLYCSTHQGLYEAGTCTRQAHDYSNSTHSCMRGLAYTRTQVFTNITSAVVDLAVQVNHPTLDLFLKALVGGMCGLTATCTASLTKTSSIRN